MKKLSTAAAAIAALSVALSPLSVSAFCGFYVGGADASLTNNATMVVMMREGTGTVLSMQNDYEGPPSAFALVVPVPVVLDEEDVRTLPREIFARVDRLASPRLVEYWELDPCAPTPPVFARRRGFRRRARAGGGGGAEALGVTIEAQFEVGEYEIAILSARDSSGLETWLRQEEYNIPEGAGPVLRPYVEQGTKFFVARVNVDRVTFEDGRALLSPLRIHYESEQFELPVRLGLLNSAGAQDLVVHILARNQRYETANYPNVTIPTNLDVDDEVRDRFPEFYASLFDATLERNPGSVVTEYAWQATSCDPCPGPTLTAADLVTLGSDVLTSGTPSPVRGRGRRFPRRFGSNFVLTRLHYRYGRDGLDQDLVFRPAPPITGGREVMMGSELEHGATESSSNNFQGRYAIRHPWEGAIACDAPVRGRWGRPPSANGPGLGPVPPPAAAQNTAFAPRGRLRLAAVLRTDAPEIGVEAGLASIADVLAGATPDAHGAPADPPEAVASEELSAPDEDDELPPGRGPDGPTADGCGSCSVTPRGHGVPFGVGSFLAALALLRRRR